MSKRNLAFRDSGEAHLSLSWSIFCKDLSYHTLFESLVDRNIYLLSFTDKRTNERNLIP